MFDHNAILLKFTLARHGGTSLLARSISFESNQKLCCGRDNTKMVRSGLGCKVVIWIASDPYTVCKTYHLEAGPFIVRPVAIIALQSAKMLAMRIIKNQF